MVFKSFRANIWAQADDEEDVIRHIEPTEEAKGELVGILIGWLKKFDLKDEVRVNI